MFATIKTNGATTIAIYIPHEGADKSLPMLAAMLEQNALFISEGYQELTTVKPAMGIQLGDEFRVENYGVEAMALAVPPSEAVLSEGFVPASPSVFANAAKGIKAKDEELQRVRTELSFVKSELQRAREQIEALTSVQEA